IASLFMAGYDVVQMAFSLSIASIIAIFAAIILFKWVGMERGFMKKIVLNDRTTTVLGYVSSDERTELIGAYRTAVTGMRPAATMLYGDERIDVVSECAFIDKDSHVKVSNVEGNRVFVRKVNEYKEEAILLDLFQVTPIIVIALILIALVILFTFVPVALLISALSAGVKVGLFTLVGMRLRRVIPSRVINPLIRAYKAGLDVKTNQLESHYLAGGNVDRVV